MVVNYSRLTTPTYLDCVLEISDPRGGTVQGAGKYLLGSEVTVTAVPGENALFTGWFYGDSGEQASSEASFTFVIEDNIRLQARFVMLWQVNLTVQPEDGGTASGAGTYQDGQTASVLAASAQGYLFSAWENPEGQTLSDSPEYSFPVREDTSLTARFGVLCVITITPSLEGAGEPSGAGSYAYGQQVTLSANTAKGYQFTGWQDSAGNLLSTEEEYSFTVTGDLHLTAVYEVYSRLPAGYQEVEYLANPSKNYITNIGLPKNVANLTLDFKIDITDTAQGALLGNQKMLNTPYGNRYSHINYGWYLWYDPSGRSLSVYTQSSSLTNTSSAATKWNIIPLPLGEENLLEIHADIPNQKLIFNGEEVDTAAYQYSASYPESNFALFAFNRVVTSSGTTTAPGSSRVNMKLYWFKAWEGETPVVDLVPCVNPDGKTGLYDLVTNVFYPPTLSSSNFEPGPDV